MRRTNIKLKDLLMITVTDEKIKIIQLTEDRKNPVVFLSGDYYDNDENDDLIKEHGEKFVTSFYSEDDGIVIRLRRN